MADPRDDLNSIYHAVSWTTLPVVMGWMWETLTRCQDGASSHRYGQRKTDAAPGSAWSVMLTERSSAACYAALDADSSVSRMCAARYAARAAETLQEHEAGNCTEPGCTLDSAAGLAARNAIDAACYAVADLAYRHPAFGKDGPDALADATRQVWADVAPARVLTAITSGPIQCHGTDVQPPKVGEVYRLQSFTGNQPPRETWTDVVVTEVEPPKPLMHNGRVHYTRLDWGTGTCLNTELFVKRARRPLDPTPPGPPAVGDQPSLFDLLETAP